MELTVRRWLKEGRVERWLFMGAGAWLAGGRPYPPPWRGGHFRGVRHCHITLLHAYCESSWFAFWSWVALKRCFLLSVLSQQQAAVSPVLQQNRDTRGQGSSCNMVLGFLAHLCQLQHCRATGRGLKQSELSICNLKIHFLEQKYISLIQD